MTSLAIGSLTVRRNVFRYHLGSLAFGSFIIAVIQLIRAILKYYEQLGCKRRLTSSEIRVHVNLTADVFPASPRHSFCLMRKQAKQAKNKVLVMVLKICGFCIWCFEKCVWCSDVQMLCPCFFEVTSRCSCLCTPSFRGSLRCILPLFCHQVKFLNKSPASSKWPRVATS